MNKKVNLDQKVLR